MPLSRQPVEHDGDDYKQLKAAMARQLRGECDPAPPKHHPLPSDAAARTSPTMELLSGFEGASRLPVRKIVLLG